MFVLSTFVAGWLVCWLCPSSLFPLSNVIVIVCILFVSSRDSDVKCTLDAVLGRGVDGHTTLYISRAVVGASIFIDDVGGSSLELEFKNTISSISVGIGSFPTN